MSEEAIAFVDEDEVVGAVRPKLTLALSGGGTRGYAHIGVLQALEEAGVPIDGIAGCSAGGMMGGLYAAGYDAGVLSAEVRDLISVRGILKSIVPTRSSGVPLFEQLRVDNRFQTNLHNYIAPDTTFADLTLPFSVDVVCLDRRKLVTLNSGKVSNALRATVAVPGFFPSVKIDGYRYVDGGVLNNIPVQAARRLGGGAPTVVVAIDLGDARREDNLTEDTSRLRPARELMEVVGLMLTHLTRSELKRTPPDLLIRPKLPSRRSPLSDFRQIETIIQAGYDATRAALPDLSALLTR